MNELKIESRYRILPNYPHYMIFDDGTVYSAYSKKFLKPNLKKSGYLEVMLTKNDGEHKYELIHRLVALCFCETKPNANEVNHINGNKTDNRAENLEWVTRNENLKHAFESGLRFQDVSARRIIATNIETGEQQKFESIYKASRFLNISQGNICQACKGIRPYAGGYYWEYESKL